MKTEVRFHFSDGKLWNVVFVLLRLTFDYRFAFQTLRAQSDRQQNGLIEQKLYF